MEHQFRRGIYRPNAQRLSISLAPLVAQRSLLFRVKSDLATQTSYGEMSPKYSPGLFAVTASAQVVSAALSMLSAASVMSSASVYSQDSWKSPCQVAVVSVDTRRNAIAFNPSVQWSDHSESESDKESVGTPLQSANVSTISVLLVVKDLHVEGINPMHTVDINCFPSKAPFDTESSKAVECKKLKKKRVQEDSAKRASGASRAVGKVISRLSIKPYRKSYAGQPTPAIHLSPEVELPEFRQASPMRFSFIAMHPSIPLPTHLACPKPMLALDSPHRKDITVPDYKLKQDKEKTHRVRASLPARPSTPATISFKKGHKRCVSSPAVLRFNVPAWEVEEMPPVPPIPQQLVSPVKEKPVIRRLRAKSVIGRGHA